MDDKLFERLAKRFGYRVINPNVYHQRDSMPTLDLSECYKCGVWYVSFYSHKCQEVRNAQA